MGAEIDKLEQLTLTLKKSLAGRLRNHQACAIGLGLKKVNQTVKVEATPENKGMVRKIAYMLQVS